MAVSQNAQVIVPPLPVDQAGSPSSLSNWWNTVKYALDQVLPQLVSNVNELVAGRVTTLTFQKLNAPPKNIGAGQVAWADGTNWNPGAGDGLYEYRADAAWHKL